MKQELQQAIDSAARAVSNANTDFENARKAVKAKEEHIEQLTKERRAAVEALPELVEAAVLADEKAKEAAGRYAFYCNEAIFHPY